MGIFWLSVKSKKGKHQPLQKFPFPLFCSSCEVSQTKHRTHNISFLSVLKSTTSGTGEIA